MEKPCRYCKMTIPFYATICPYCRTNFEEAMEEEIQYKIRNRDRIRLRQAEEVLNFYFASPLAFIIAVLAVYMTRNPGLTYVITLVIVIILGWFFIGHLFWGYVLLMLSLYLLGKFNFWILIGLIAIGYYIHCAVQQSYRVVEQSKNPQ
jgi:hypothetical protein